MRQKPMEAIATPAMVGQDRPEQKLAFVLVPGFSMVAFSCAIDAIRTANQVTGRTAYAWQAVSAEGSGAISSTGLTVIATELAEAASPDMVVVCGGDRSHDYHNTALTHWLHSLAKQGKAIGSISDGAYILAEAGLFDKVPSTIHWKCQDAYRERFPDLDIRTSILEISDKRFSCAGGTSSLDLMLYFIRRDHGDQVASQIADNYFHDAIRDGSSEQHVTHAFRMAKLDPLLAGALLLMEQNLESPLTIAGIARELEVTRRQIDRIFARHLSTPPQAHYRDMRLSRAAGLLVQTGLSVSEIALGCGFHSASHLGKYFKKRYSETPKQYRLSRRSS